MALGGIGVYSFLWNAVFSKAQSHLGEVELNSNVVTRPEFRHAILYTCMVFGLGVTSDLVLFAGSVYNYGWKHGSAGWADEPWMHLLLHSSVLALTLAGSFFGTFLNNRDLPSLPLTIMLVIGHVISTGTCGVILLMYGGILGGVIWLFGISVVARFVGMWTQRTINRIRGAGSRSRK